MMIKVHTIHWWFAISIVIFDCLIWTKKKNQNFLFMSNPIFWNGLHIKFVLRVLLLWLKKWHIRSFIQLYRISVCLQSKRIHTQPQGKLINEWNQNKKIAKHNNNHTIEKKRLKTQNQAKEESYPEMDCVCVCVCGQGFYILFGEIVIVILG